MTGTAAEDRAKARFFIISLLRLAGVVLVITSLLVLNRVIALPPLAGWIGLAIGLIDTFIVPQMLARRWKTPTS
jgi:hypothetical protein